ncbi:TonB-dependent receptor [Flavobacterium eburneipallidum]|uniref:TonB-dependent receptor n=1 Tax=Flavobacterium eburneipallidum TaxID=3003263 RepID=UPI002482FFC0|nr:TonB-dependent receptor [Flavobacterium eburneipallidum]
MKLTYFISSLFFVSAAIAQNTTGLELADGMVYSNTVTKSSGTATGTVVADESSIIKGTVIEEATGKPLPGVNIMVVGTPLGTTSDAEGRFSFRKMEPGKYNLEFSMFSFETKIISEVEVVKGEATTLTVSLSEKNNVLNEVVIRTVKAKVESVQSLLTVQKNSVRVSDGISAESIKKTPDRTASDVLKRISGASIQNNKFVIIRGLNDRYNTTYLNGSPLPSTEPDRKAFSFDIFPSNMLDNLVIYKTASPDLPGEFAGGVIDINTKMAPDKNFQSVSIGAGYNAITTGKSKLVANDAKVGLPSSFPSSAELIALQNPMTGNIQQVAELAKNYQTDWGVSEDKFSPNTSFQLSLGRYFKFKGEQSLSLLASLTNNVSNVYAESNRKFYEVPGVLQEDFSDESYSTQRLTGAILNFSFKINSNNKLSFKNLYSRTTETRFTDRSGTKVVEPEPTITTSTNRFFSKNNIYTGQFIGEHFLPESKIKINWVGSYSNVNREIPSERRNTYEYRQFLDGSQTEPRAPFVGNNVGTDYPGSIFTSTNNESIYSAKFDVSKKVNFSDEFSADIKVGGITQSRKREFQARQLGYVIFSGTVDGFRYGTNTFLPTIAALPNATIFNTANMGILSSTSPRSSGLTLYEGTKGSDYYDAEANLNAGYLMIDNVFHKLRVVWGARLENYSQHLTSKSDIGDPILVDDSQLDILPSVNFIYKLNKTQNIRLSGSKTLNRPEFRELAPFLFFDNETRFNTSGNPDLKITEIINFDLRYEFFPGKSQIFSLSAFYKDFKNPIELQARANNSNRYENAKSGKNYGVELEFRTMLSSVLGTKETKILDDLTLFSNLAVIRSKVDISNLINSGVTVDSPMQGQSPYVFNAGLQYSNIDAGWSLSANMNRIGDRITIHGNQTASNATPAYWEKARTILDFQIAKNLFKSKIELKLNIQNVLAQDLIFYQNNFELTGKEVKGFRALTNSIFTGDSQNINGYDKEIDDQTWITKFGPTFSFTATYNF